MVLAITPAALPAQAIAQPSAQAPGAGHCLPASIIRRSDLVVLGIYGGGGRRVAYRLDGSRRGAEVIAVAGHLARPTVLIITAYESAIWDLSGLTGQPVAAVYLAGFRAQGVVGLAPGTPVAFRQTAGNNGPHPGAADNPCPDLRRASARPAAMSMAIRIRRYFGKWPTAFYGSNAPFSFRIGGGLVPPYAAAPDIAAVRSEVPPIPGDAAMRQEVERSDRSRAFHEARERRGRRLLYLRWNGRGDVTTVETESFGEDHWRERMSSDG